MTGVESASRRVALCVDDFGLKPQVNEAVARLVDAGVVTVVGCKGTGAAWTAGAALLRGSRRARIDVGLHLNLTQRLDGSGDDLMMPLPQLIAMSLLRALPEERLKRTVVHQLEAFEAAFGEPPDFVDGHQHVHQLPQVRQVLLQALESLRQRHPGVRPWLRYTGARGGGASLKHRVIEALGAHALRREARTRGHAMNRALLGVYGFDADEQQYRQRLETWLSEAQDGDLLMLHPAVPRAEGTPVEVTPEGDGIAAAREVEYRVLTADAVALLARHGVQPTRLSRCSGILDR